MKSVKEEYMISEVQGNCKYIIYVPLLTFFLTHLPKHQLYCSCRCIMQYLHDLYKCDTCHSVELQPSHLLPKTMNITEHRINNCAFFYWL